MAGMLGLIEQGAFRADESEVFSGIADLLAQAPDRRDGYYRVPRVLE